MTGSNKLFNLMAILSVIVAIVTFRFLALGWQASFFPVLEANIDASQFAFATHVLASPIALVTALLQFQPRLRATRPGLHRWTGRVYAVAVLFGGLSGLLLAIASAADRPIAAAGFGVLAVIWLAITARGVLAARAGQIAQHRNWMMRSFALTFAAVTLRLQLAVFFSMGMQYGETSNYVAWLCWVPNLLVVEWLIRRRTSRKIYPTEA